SECDTTSPAASVGAFAQRPPGLPPGLGGMATRIAPGRTGLHFEPANVAHLTAAVERLRADPEAAARMGQAARREYQEKYTAEANHDDLMAIYERARGLAARPPAKPDPAEEK